MTGRVTGRRAGGQGQQEGSGPRPAHVPRPGRLGGAAGRQESQHRLGRRVRISRDSQCDPRAPGWALCRLFISESIPSRCRALPNRICRPSRPRTRRRPCAPGGPAPGPRGQAAHGGRRWARPGRGGLLAGPPTRVHRQCEGPRLTGCQRSRAPYRPCPVQPVTQALGEPGRPRRRVGVPAPDPRSVGVLRGEEGWHACPV